VAQLRLAGVLLDEKAYDEALKLLGTANSCRSSPPVADRKGDVLVAQNKIAEARAAYEAALAAMDRRTRAASWCSIKLEAIGGTVPPAPKPLLKHPDAARLRRSAARALPSLQT
jgi:predicted negative regulator of RcsB-dependent stress response